MCAQEEREGVTGGATGGQRRGRMEGKTRGEKGRTREAYMCVHARMHASKKGRKSNATDLGVEEWRTPVGRAETTRKGEGSRERRGEWLTTIMTAMQEKAKEGGGVTGEEGPGSAQHAKIGRGGRTNRCWHGRSARE
jgi:hypothetical protein